MFDYTRLESLPDGEEKLRYIKKCIAVSDGRKNYSEALKLRFLYIQESVLKDDNFRAMIMFPEYMALFNEHPEEHDCFSFMTAFRWILDNMTDYYQISTDANEKYFEKFREYCLKFGYSLKTYYQLRVKYCSICAPEQVSGFLTLFRKTEADELSECNACEMNTEILAELQFGSEEKAVKLLSSLRHRNISCNEVPKNTYGNFAVHFLRTGNLDEADYYADLLLPLIKNDLSCLKEISEILLLKSYTSPNDAYNIFCKYLELFIKVKNPVMKFAFAEAATRFFENINRDENEEITMKLPRTFELYNEENLYDPDFMFAYFRDIASDIADKFDKKIGRSYYNDILNYEYPSEPVRELSLPEHGTAARTPFSVAVPFISEETIPSQEKIIELLKSVPDIEFYDISAKESDTIIICGYNSYIETNFICKINICEPEDIEEYHPVHKISEDLIEDFMNRFSYCLMISSIFHKGTENAETTALLQFANVLNLDNSPVILSVTNGMFLSADWVSFHAIGRLPLFDKYMYGVHVYPSVYDETHFDVMTTGLAQQASRELAVVNVEEEDLDFICMVVSQISDLICGFTELRDEGFKTGFGVVFNEESEVQFSWLPVEKAYPDSFTFTDKELAVPILYLSADDAENDKGFFINEIPDEIRKKIDFRSSLKSLRIEAVLAKRNLPFAMDALERFEDSELIIGLNINIPDESSESDYDADEICIKAESYNEDNETVTGTITIGSDLNPEYSTGVQVTMSTDDIIFWRFEYDGNYFSADETYMIY